MPVPVLLVTAVAILVFGTDHPNGRWKDRHLLSPGNLAVAEHDQEKSEDIGVKVSAVPADVEKDTPLSTKPNSKKNSQVEIFVEPIPQLSGAHLSRDRH